MSMFQTSFVRSRFSEPSTWVGLAMFAASIKQAVTAMDPSAIGQALGGLLGMFMPEGQSVSQAQPPQK